MSATPFRLAVCRRRHRETKTPQRGWQVVQRLATGELRKVSPKFFGVDAKRVANAFLQGLLLGWFAMERLRQEAQRACSRRDEVPPVGGGGDHGAPEICGVRD